MGCMNIDHMRSRSGFVKVQERICGKLERWRSRTLSQTGKLVLIKFNFSGILVYIVPGIKLSNYRQV